MADSFKRNPPGCNCNCNGPCYGTVCAVVTPYQPRCGNPQSGLRYSITVTSFSGGGSYPFALPVGTTSGCRTTVLGNQTYRIGCLVSAPGSQFGVHPDHIWAFRENVYVPCGETVTVNFNDPCPQIDECVCCGFPPDNLNITWVPGAYSTENYPSGGLTFSCTGPSYLPGLGAGYFSDETWTDPQTGFEMFYSLGCYATQYSLAIGSANPPQAPGQVYLWSVGGRDAVNFCNPFLLAKGSPSQGFHPNGRWVVSG